MAIEFNPDSSKQISGKKFVKKQGATSNKAELAQTISGQNKPEFKDASDAIEKLLNGEADMYSALGFIKSMPDPQPENNSEEVSASELAQQLLDGEIDRETFKAAMRSLAKNDSDDE